MNLTGWDVVSRNNDKHKCKQKEYLTSFSRPTDCELLVLLGSAYFVVHDESRHCGAEHTDVESQEAHQEP